MKVSSGSDKRTTQTERAISARSASLDAGSRYLRWSFGLAGPLAVVFAALFLFANESLAAEESKPEGRGAMASASRPFPIVEVKVGDVPLAIPKDWVDSKFIKISAGKQPFIHLVNVNHRSPPRATHFEMPPLASFNLTQPAPGLARRNIEERQNELKARWPQRQPDEDGFWQWKTRDYVLIHPKHKRPFDQPMTVFCFGLGSSPNSNDRRCQGRFYYTDDTSVSYDFFDSDVPKSQWAELDRKILELMNFLDSREPWPGPNQNSR